ncbi:helix-turn-helix domain-containing protein [Treponema primitia]|uniref:helix-turn-helix domain-containing protein n=1 Tax=Treponema primitia TaxID=88058 RepID=UPI003980878F
MEEHDLRRILSANIKRYRGLRGWSQAVLAEKLDLSTNFLADIETGKSWVSSLTLVKLANMLEIEVYELFRPDEAADDETKELMHRFVKDISISFNQSLGKLSQKYLT